MFVQLARQSGIIKKLDLVRVPIDFNSIPGTFQPSRIDRTLGQVSQRLHSIVDTATRYCAGSQYACRPRVSLYGDAHYAPRV